MTIKIDKSSLVRNLAKKTKLAYLLDRAIADGDFDWEYTYTPKLEDDAWHPSGHCTPSPYQLYHYAMSSGRALNQKAHIPDGSAPIQKNRKEGFTPALYKTFQVGHFWHGFLQHVVVEKLGFATWDNVERSGMKAWGHETRDDSLATHPRPFHWVTGSGDIAPCDIPEYGECIVDFKTMGSHMFKPNVPPGDTIIKWECQLNVYMDFFDLDKAIILGINKDSPHDFKEFEFRLNQPLIDTLYAKWELVSECLREQIEPEEDFEIPLPIEGPVDP